MTSDNINPKTLSDYEKYRGKCKEISEHFIALDPTLILVRGYYMCPTWGQQPHWWCKKQDGTIFDPTSDQFPSKGRFTYIEFDGKIQCSDCGKEITEEEADIDGNYAFCSYQCHARFVGV